MVPHRFVYFSSTKDISDKLQLLFHRHSKGDTGNALLSPPALNLLPPAGAEHPQAGCTLRQEKRRGWRWLPRQSKIQGITFPAAAARVWPQEALHNGQAALHILKKKKKRDFLLALALECAPTYAQSSRIRVGSPAGWEQNPGAACALSA